MIPDLDKLTAGQRSARDVGTLLKARCSLFWIVTTEEERSERLISDECEAAQYAPRTWDSADGECDRTGKEIGTGRQSSSDPGSAGLDALFPAMREERSRVVWILRDVPQWLQSPAYLRSVRSLARRFALAPRPEARAIVILTPRSDVPPELQGAATVIEWPRPDREEIRSLLEAGIEALPEKDANGAPVREAARPRNGDMEKAIDAAVGLTADEASACYKRSLVELRRIDPATVAREKKRVIKAARGLEWYDPLPGGLAAVGGLEGLKTWIGGRALAFTPAARSYGLPAPRGILLVGVPGTGKSLAAKAIATALGFPLLRFDLGGSRSKYVGESESNLRAVLKIIESIAPCVLWIDEIEKMLAGATEGAADGGVSADALGTLLSWMQERAGSVFVVATANDVSRLPPELLRKGRFDEIFSVTLPTATERTQILAVTLKTYARTLAGEFALRDVAAATEGFTGAEIAQLVPDAMFRAFADGAREITADDMLACARETIPLSKTAPEKIQKITEWCKGRARPAGLAEKIGAATGRGGLDL